MNLITIRTIVSILVAALFSTTCFAQDQGNTTVIEPAESSTPTPPTIQPTLVKQEIPAPQTVNIQIHVVQDKLQTAYVRYARARSGVQETVSREQITNLRAQLQSLKLQMEHYTDAKVATEKTRAETAEAQAETDAKSAMDMAGNAESKDDFSAAMATKADITDLAGKADQKALTTVASQANTATGYGEWAIFLALPALVLGIWARFGNSSLSKQINALWDSPDLHPNPQPANLTDPAELRLADPDPPSPAAPPNPPA